jgi:tetratricopeptide (TPR) repeat protein
MINQCVTCNYQWQTTKAEIKCPNCKSDLVVSTEGVTTSKVSEQIIDKIKRELDSGDIRTYLENCKKNYDQYVEAATTLFKDYYDMAFQKIDQWYDLFTTKALKLEKLGKIEKEKEVLKSAIKDNIDTPYIYERLAYIYRKEGNIKDAYNVCKKWFDTGYWKIPNMATTSLAILNLMEKLEKDLQTS